MIWVAKAEKDFHECVTVSKVTLLTSSVGYQAL